MTMGDDDGRKVRDRVREISEILHSHRDDGPEEKRIVLDSAATLYYAVTLGCLASGLEPTAGRINYIYGIAGLAIERAIDSIKEGN